VTPHFEVLLEEPSAEAFFEQVLPKILGGRASFRLSPFNGKQDLLRKLPSRLRALAAWRPDGCRIVVVIDSDGEDCRELKRRVQGIAVDAGFGVTRSAAGPGKWNILDRLVIEELEAWYFGDWSAVRSAFPRVPASIPRRSAFRDPDAIDGTWEAFQRILQSAGHEPGGLRKIHAAREIGRHFDPSRCSSRSFRALRDALVEVLP
jgi:hypothetical protein